MTNTSASDDFFNPSAVVTIPDGVTTVNTVLVLINDNIPEGNETFLVEITGTRLGAEIGAQNTMELVVMANDEPHGQLEFEQVEISVGQLEFEQVENSVRQLEFEQVENSVGQLEFEQVEIEWCGHTTLVSHIVLSSAPPPPPPPPPPRQPSLVNSVAEPTEGNSTVNINVIRGPGSFGRVTIDFEVQLQSSNNHHSYFCNPNSDPHTTPSHTCTHTHTSTGGRGWT